MNMHWDHWYSTHGIQKVVIKWFHLTDRDTKYDIYITIGVDFEMFLWKYIDHTWSRYF